MFSISLWNLQWEHIISVQWTKLEIRFICGAWGMKEFKLMYRPVKVGFWYTPVMNNSSFRSTSTSKKKSQCMITLYLHSELMGWMNGIELDMEGFCILIGIKDRKKCHPHSISIHEVWGVFETGGFHRNQQKYWLTQDPRVCLSKPHWFGHTWCYWNQILPPLLLNT